MIQNDRNHSGWLLSAAAATAIACLLIIRPQAPLPGRGDCSVGEGASWRGIAKQLLNLRQCLQRGDAAPILYSG